MLFIISNQKSIKMFGIKYKSHLIPTVMNSVLIQFKVTYFSRHPVDFFLSTCLVKGEKQKIKPGYTHFLHQQSFTLCQTMSNNMQNHPINNHHIRPQNTGANSCQYQFCSFVICRRVLNPSREGGAPLFLEHFL